MASNHLVAGSNPAERAKFCSAKFGIEAALKMRAGASILAAEIPKDLTAKQSWVLKWR